MRNFDEICIGKYKEHLIEEEKSKATVEKYVRDLRAFYRWLSENESCGGAEIRIEKSSVLSYKLYLSEKYATASVNSVLSSLNGFFAFLEWFELRVKTLKVQRRIFRGAEKELTKSEYKRLLSVASQKGGERLSLLMQTVCSTGIRVS